jgi:hypothetical protein
MDLGSIGTRSSQFHDEDNKFYFLMPFHFIKREELRSRSSSRMTEGSEAIQSISGLFRP